MLGPLPRVPSAPIGLANTDFFVGFQLYVSSPQEAFSVIPAELAASPPGFHFPYHLPFPFIFENMIYFLGSGLSPNHLWPQFLGPVLPHGGISVNKDYTELNGPLLCLNCVPGTGHLSPVGSGKRN